MDKELKEILIVFVIMMSASCTENSPLTLMSTDADIIGHTISEAREHLSLEITRYFVIDEPPGVPRAIKGTTPNGDLIELYFRRRSGLFSENMSWTIGQLNDQEVIGIARCHDNKWIAYGDAMWRSKSIPSE